MNVERACAILHIDVELLDMDPEMVGRQYRKMSIKYHPDKINGNNHLFHRLTEAKQCLETYLDQEMEMNDVPEEYDVHYGSVSSQYRDQIYDYLGSILGNELQQIVWEKLTKLCREKALLWAKSLHRNVLRYVVGMLEAHKETWNMDQEFVDQVRRMLEPRMVVVRPSLEDLFEARVYKLSEQGQVYFIPLWVDETSFTDTYGNELIVWSVPQLPDHVTVDEKNHIHVLVQNMESNMKVCKGVTIDVSLLKDNVTRFPGKGIPVVNDNDMYDVETRGDLWVHLKGTYGSL